MCLEDEEEEAGEVFLREDSSPNPRTLQPPPSTLTPSGGGWRVQGGGSDRSGWRVRNSDPYARIRLQSSGFRVQA